MSLQDDQPEKVSPSEGGDDDMPQFVPPPEDMLKRLIDKLSGEGKLTASQNAESSEMERAAEPTGLGGVGSQSQPVVLAKSPLPSELEEVLPIRRPEKTPWTLQQFFDGEIDLDVELAKRFPSMPIMSKIDFRTL
ncbi:MAG: hypothetical protein KC496_13775, partial [Anaerolineae bacterium]|nr:hypothetical protein [Anaerolineae bacterium]